jgi:hypothetical protein
VDTVAPTQASFVFLEGHEIPFVVMQDIVKFLANGLCKSDICESVVTPFVCVFPSPNHTVLPSVYMHLATCDC